MSQLNLCVPSCRRRCRSSFQRKEKRLQQFYAAGGGRFGAEAPTPLPAAALEAEWRAALLFWAALSLAASLSLALLVGWFGAACAAAVWVLVGRAGGADRLELQLHGEGGWLHRSSPGLVLVPRRAWHDPSAAAAAAVPRAGRRSS